MNEVNISITGNCGAGKTVTALALQQFLQSHGHEVNIDDEIIDNSTIALYKAVGYQPPTGELISSIEPRIYKIKVSQR